MATSTVYVKYRPLRIGFLVDEGEINQLSKAAGINSMLWGGVYNPIIPVSKNNSEFVSQLLKLFNVDVLYKVSESEEIRAIYDEYHFLRDPSHIGERIFYEDWHSKRNISAYLDAINIVNYYWEKEFKHSTKKFKSNCLLVDWDAADKHSNLFAMMFGYFPDSYNLKYDYKQAFKNGLKAKTVKLASSFDLKKVSAKAISPILATGLELEKSGGGFKGNGIYVGENSFVDLVNFWNLRASGITLRFLDKDDLSGFEDYIQSYLSRQDELPNSNPNISDNISVYYQGDSVSVTSIIEKFTLKNKNFILSPCNEYSWNGLNIKVDEVFFKSERSLANTEKSYGSYSVSFALPEKKFLTEHIEKPQSIVAAIRTYSDFTHPRYTFKLPFLRQLNEFYSREVSFDPWSLRVSNEDIGLIIKTDDSSLEIRPIHQEKVIKEIFKLAGFKSSVNQAGLLVEQIVSKMRENNALEACRVFKITEVRELIKSLKVNESISWSEATKMIWNEGNFSKFEELYIESRDKKKLNAVDVLNFLIKKNILRPRLKLRYRFFTPKKEFRCRQCGLKENIKISNYLGEYECNYCQYKNSMPQYIKEDFQGAANKYFEFIKSGLFAKNNNQEGAIPVILTLLTLNRVVHEGNLFYSTSTNLGGAIKCEVDFSVLNIKFGKMEFGISECKSKGQEITTQDVTNLKHVQDKIDELGLECYMIFSKTNDSFSDAEIKLFKQLNEENRRFILLSNRELEPYEPYWDLEEVEELPNKYAMSLEDMWLNSQFLYLRDDES